MKLQNSNYLLESDDPIFFHKGKAYNANHLGDKKIGELIVDGCQIFKKEKTKQASVAVVSEQK